MKVLLITFLIWIANYQASIYAQADSISSTVVVTEHPRILLPREEENAFRKAVQADSNLLRVHQLILSQCDSLLLIRRTALSALRVERIQHSQTQEALRRLFVLAYGWRLTGRQDYFARAKSELWQVLILTHWNPERVEDLAEITTAASLAYDWLYTNLSPKERSFAQMTILEKGLMAALAPRDSTWMVPSDYQNQVINTGLVYGALAIYETQPAFARSILNRSIRSTKQLLTLYEPDGAYPYGYSAWSYATNFTALLISALQKEFKSDFGLLNQTSFLKTAAYGLQMRAPSGNCFNYGESTPETALQASQFWFAQHPPNQGAEWSEQTWLTNRVGSSLRQETLLPAILVWSYDQTLAVPTQSPRRVWVGNGKTPVALLRSAWGDSTALFIGLKAGTPSLPGGQMDVGSFVVEAQGIRWAIDLGGQDTDSLRLAGIAMHETGQSAPRWLAFRNSVMSHNTLVANYRLQLVNGYAPIISSSNQASFLNAITDLTTLYEESLVSAKRGVAIVDDQSMLIQDEVETGSKEAVLRWAMVTAAQVEVVDSHRVVLRQSGKHFLVEVDPSSGFMLRTWSTGPRYEHDSANPGTLLVGFEVKVPPHTKQSWRVHMVPGSLVTKAGLPFVALSEWPHD